jgi:hypothetical protein
MSAFVEPNFLLVTAGPTGAGKSKLPEIVFNHLGTPFDTKNPPPSVLVDELVENDQTYITEVHRMLVEYVKSRKTSLDGVSKDTTQPVPEYTFTENDLQQPELKTRFNDIYWSVRNKTEGEPYTCGYTLDIEQSLTNDNCDPEDSGNTGGKSYCSKVHDAKLKGLIGKETVVYETQGTYFPEWLWQNCFIHGTPVIISYSLVKRDELRGRIIGRTLSDINDFYKNFPTSYSIKAPRLTTYPDDTNPSTTIEGLDFDKKLADIVVQLNTFIEKCSGTCETIFTKLQDKKRKSQVRIIIYDNNGSKDTPPTLLYDSYVKPTQPPKELETKILDALGINSEFVDVNKTPPKSPKEIGGKRKTRRNKRITFSKFYKKTSSRKNKMRNIKKRNKRRFNVQT